MKYQLRAQGRSPLPEKEFMVLEKRNSNGERPHYGIAGKVLFAGESPGKRDPM